METLDLIALFTFGTMVISVIILLKVNTIIMTNAEILALLEEANTTTNEIAADLQDLIDSEGVSQEVADKLQAHVAALKAVAATHTPGGPVEPPTE